MKSRYVTPRYTAQAINRAGVILVERQKNQDIDVGDAIETIDNWRASHAYPSQIFFVTLKRRAISIYKFALVAQRIKRLPSIISKLQRENAMKLSQMQDVGGCRAASVGRVKTRHIHGDKWRNGGS